MITKRAFVGARGIDSLPFSQSGTLQQARALRAAGTDFVVGYLGAMSAVRLQTVHAAGLAFMPVTFANAWDGQKAVSECMKLGITQGCTVWLDLEGEGPYNTPPAELIAKINAWADTVARGGYQPGIYVGSPQPLTSEELWNLKVVRYWNALSREQDRFGKLAEPKCGWCMWQMHPSVMWAGVWSDMNIIGQDFHGRLPSWVAPDEDATAA